MHTRDTACLSSWHPLLAATGVPTPKTAIVPCQAELLHLRDGQMPDGYEAFMRDILHAAEDFSVPFSLRTGHSSGKRQWPQTCHVTDLAQLPPHVTALVDWSACVDMVGLPTDIWVVRELLDPAPAFHTIWGMPVGRERRYFIDNGHVVCHHPYLLAVRFYFPLNAASGRTRSLERRKP